MSRVLTHEIGLLERCKNAWLSRGRDDSHWVALSLSPLHLLSHAWALLALVRKLLGDRVKLTSNELLLLVITHGEVVLLLQSDEHVAEVVTDKVLEERVDVVGGIDVVLLHHFVGEVGTSLEGKTLRLAESVVTVEEDIFDLGNRLASINGLLNTSEAT